MQVTAAMRLLEVENVLSSLALHSKDELLATVGAAPEAKLKAQAVIRLVRGGDLFDQLRSMIKHLLPIKVALRLMERNTARLDVVISCYGKLYNHFYDMPGVALHACQLQGS